MKAEGGLDYFQMAVEFKAGRIITDRHCGSPEGIIHAFLPLMLMKPEESVAWLKDAAMIFCHADDWGPTSGNGIPQCYTAQKLTAEQLEQFKTQVRALEAAEL